MTKPAARIGDSHNKGSIKTGSPNVIIGSQPAARVGDVIKCDKDPDGSINNSSACLIINGKRAARVGDTTDRDSVINSGMGNVLIADGDPFIEIGDTGKIDIGPNVFFG